MYLALLDEQHERDAGGNEIRPSYSRKEYNARSGALVIGTANRCEDPVSDENCTFRVS